MGKFKLGKKGSGSTEILDENSPEGVAGRLEFNEETDPISDAGDKLLEIQGEIEAELNSEIGSLGGSETNAPLTDNSSDNNSDNSDFSDASEENSFDSAINANIAEGEKNDGISLISGRTLLAVTDKLIPLMILGGMKMAKIKTKKKLKDFQLTEDEKDQLEVPADKVADEIFAKLTPMQQFMVLMGTFYGSKLGED